MLDKLFGQFDTLQKRLVNDDGDGGNDNAGGNSGENWKWYFDQSYWIY